MIRIWTVTGLTPETLGQYHLYMREIRFREREERVAAVVAAAFINAIYTMSQSHQKNRREEEDSEKK